jgi:hypothetical protein
MSTIVEPKPGIDMGRVLVEVLVENAEDHRKANCGEIPPDAVRHLKLEARVDSGATFFCLPESAVHTLGLATGQRADMTAC